MTGARTGTVHGENLRGRSALPLLACRRPGARVLFLLSTREATVTTAPLHEAQFRRVPLDGLSELPFADRAFDCVVLDSEGVSTGALARRIRHAAASREIRRVLRQDGECLLLARSNRIPRSRCALGRYRLSLGAKGWMDAMAAASFAAADAGALAADEDRITEVVLPSSRDEEASPTRPAVDYTLTSFRPQASSGPPAVEKLLDQIAGALGVRAGGRIERFLVRKIGKTAIVVSIGGRRLLVKVPLSPIARIRADRNFCALQRLHQSEFISSDMQKLIPKPVFQERYDDYIFYVEEMVDGREMGAAMSLSASWEPGALQFITDLHLQTLWPRVVDEECFRTRFAEPVRRIQHAAALRDAADAELFERIIDMMRGVVGELVPFVWSHGDFALGNCLVDDSGRLSAVVDWELFSTEGLPLLDLLQCMPVPGESNSRARWQRFDLVTSLLRDDPMLERAGELARYVTTMRVPAQAVPALLMMYWVDHVAHRIEGRGFDRVWMQKRVHQPLAALRLLTSASHPLACRG